jgi:carbamoyltransferase
MHKKIVEKILDQKIVAIYHGRCEAGPRALCNRSILFDPRNKKGKDIVNTVKKREFFRPFGATVLLEHAHEWFEMLHIKELPFMTMAVPCKKDKIERIPAVLHIDNTCRIQTLTEKQNKNMYIILKMFYKETGVPMLLNTSFNLAGMPLANTKEMVENTMNNSKINYLFKIKEENV